VFVFIAAIHSRILRSQEIAQRGHALLNRGATGLVTPHDLALAEIGGSLNGQRCNVHFQEEFENGRMLFDYRLRAGLVTKSSGLALMRPIGFDV
jgi:DNA mismatch repair ATPase MutS